MRSVLLGAGALLLAGCGGGSGESGGTGPVSEGPLTQFGPIETRGQVNGQPIVRDMDRISTVALAGVLTDATYRPQGRPDNETALAVGNASSILFLLPSGEVVDEWKPTLANPADVYVCPQWSLDGSKLYFSSLYTGIYSVAPTSPATATQVIAASNVQYFGLSPDGTRIAYQRQPTGETDFEIFVRNVAGGATKRLTTNDVFDVGTDWLDNDRVVVSTGDFGAATTSIVKVSDLSSKAYVPMVSDLYPVGTTTDRSHLFNSKASFPEFGVSITRFAGDDLMSSKDYLDPDRTNARDASISPDGRMWAVENGGIYLTQIDPESAHTLLEPTGFLRVGVSWQPALGVTKFVGSGGRIGSSSAGIIATNRTGSNEDGSARNGLASFVSWDAETRSTSTVSEDPLNASAGAKSYVIEADRLTALRYANRPLFTGASTVSASGTANGAIVTINAKDGTVRSIVVYQETRGAKPTIRREGDKRLIEGQLLSVWDVKGKNTAPQGTSRLVLDENGDPSS